MPYRKPNSDKVRKTFLNDKPKKKGQGTHKVRLIDTPEYQVKVALVYDYIKQGMRSNEIYAMMMVEDETLTEKSFLEILKYSYAYAENALHKDRDYVFQLHMDRYERLYEKSIIMVNSYNQPLDVRQHWHIMVAKYINALKALESKEKLIGLHDKSMSIEFYDQKVLIEEKGTDRGEIPGYNIEKLNLNEQKQLLDLIKEARTVPVEGIQRVVIKKTTIEINVETGDRKQVQNVETHDIGFEEMPADVVSKMINVPDPEEEVQPHMGPVLIDDIKEKIQNKDAEDIKDKINKKTVDLFKEKLKEKRNN